MIQGAGIDLNKKIGVDGSSFSYADFSSLSLLDDNIYDVQVQSINSLDVRSSAASLNVTVLTAAPQVNRK